MDTSRRFGVLSLQCPGGENDDNLAGHVTELKFLRNTT
jgi:hypothetical protein